MRRLLALALLVTLIPWPTAVAVSHGAADMEAILAEDGTVTLRRVTSGIEHYSSYSLRTPDGYTFTGARDSLGPLAASVEGDTVSVSLGRSRGPDFESTFAGASTRLGPFYQFNVSLAANEATPTSVRAHVPDGWRLVGWFSPDRVPDNAGIIRDRGPIFASYVALPPEIPLGGPDTRVFGETILRHVSVRLTPEGGEYRLRYTFDTDHYGVLSLPSMEGASLVSLSAEYGPIDLPSGEGSLRFASPYPVRSQLGGRAIEAVWALPKPTLVDDGFLRWNVPVPAGLEDVSRVDVAIDERVTFISMHGTNGARAAPGPNATFGFVGPASVSVTAWPPLPESAVRFTDGVFVVQAPAEHEARARAVVANASRLLPTVASFVGARAGDTPFHVIYTDADVFGWEAGHYGGRNNIAIRASSLTSDNSVIEAVSTLVHESVHGYIHRLFGESVGVGLVDEGLARLAQSHVERALSDQVVACKTLPAGRQTCTKETVRPEATWLRDRYRSGLTLDPAWSPSDGGDDERAAGYTMSGLVFHAIESTTGPTTLTDIIQGLAQDLRAFERSEDPARDEARRVEVVLARIEAATGRTREDLLGPGAKLAGSTEFESCLDPLLAPPYPWETRAAPRGDCGGFAPSDARVEAALRVEGPLLPDATPKLIDMPHISAARLWQPAQAGRLILPDADPSGAVGAGLRENVAIPWGGALAIAALALVAWIRRH